MQRFSAISILLKWQREVQLPEFPMLQTGRADFYQVETSKEDRERLKRNRWSPDDNIKLIKYYFLARSGVCEYRKRLHDLPNKSEFLGKFSEWQLPYQVRFLLKDGLFLIN